MDKENGVIFSEMKDLRTKTSKEEGAVQFKKHVFGGIKESDVEEYIASITQQFNRAEEAYKDRIDEFATQTEMLSKECDSRWEQLKTRADELNERKEELLALQNENNILRKAIEENQRKMTEIETNESERIRIEESATGLMKENDLLKTELFEIQQARDHLAGENAVIKKQLKEAEASLEASDKEKSELLEDITLIRSAARQNEMKKSLALSEYSEKQNYATNQATQKMKDLIASIDEMRNDFCLLNNALEE